GARSDRQFSKYETNYVKNVVAPIINSLNCTEVWVVTPHSDVVEACINNCKIFNGFRNRLIFPSLAQYAGITAENSIFVSPDGGALKRVYNLVEEIKLVNSDHVVCANKHRDVATGNILTTQISFPENFDWKPIKHIVILDDICDGGRTFIELAKAIRSVANITKDLQLILYVTHPIFSKGLDPLYEHFDKILTTTSRKSFVNLVDEKITKDEQEEASTFDTQLQSQKVIFKNNKELYTYYL
ncbi:MAG: hypothetical protein EBU90_01810, partial [Proteobacteria bacterium]|nr:hypothetical protein [Pseudomonadota bacterium]